MCAAAEENFKLNNITNAHVLVCDSAKFANQVLRTKKYTLYAPVAAESPESSVYNTNPDGGGDVNETANLSTRSKKKHAATLRHAQRSTKRDDATTKAQKSISRPVESDEVVDTDGLFSERVDSALDLSEDDATSPAPNATSFSAVAESAVHASSTATQASAVSATPAPIASERVPLYVFRFGSVLVDPPRCGLDKLTLSLVAGYAHILYISCSPESLMRDLKVVRGIFSYWFEFFS